MGSTMAEAMIPHYRQILPTFGLYKEKHGKNWKINFTRTNLIDLIWKFNFYLFTVNYGEEIDYAQQRGESVPDLVQETLEVFEQYGGEDAFINIKYHVPTYESCVRN